MESLAPPKMSHYRARGGLDRAVRGHLRRARAIGGGRSPGREVHAAGPEISRRIRGTIPMGKNRKKKLSIWGRFPSCALTDSLLEAVTEAAKSAAVGDVILLSPVCSNFDQFQNYQQSGEKLCRSVKSISRGRHGANPHMNGETAAT